MGNNLYYSTIKSNYKSTSKIIFHTYYMHPKAKIKSTSNSITHSAIKITLGNKNTLNNVYLRPVINIAIHNVMKELSEFPEK